MVKTIAILGANGMLGQEICYSLSGSKYTIVPLQKHELDVTDAEQVRTVLSSINPDIVFNTAAFMNADRCELYPDQAFLVNVLGARIVSEVCEDLGAIHIWFSTDFVFDGITTKPYVESSEINPLSVYGLTKAAGEFSVRNLCSRYYIIRISSVFGLKGTTFLDKMIKKARSGEDLEIVNDLTISLTYSNEMIIKLQHLVESGAPFGVYHLTNQGVTTWYDLCVHVFQKLNINSRVIPITMASRIKNNNLARRPMYSALISEKLHDQSLQMSHWQDAIEIFSQIYLEK